MELSGGEPMERPIPRKTFLRQIGTTLAAAAGVAYLPSLANAGTPDGKVHPDTNIIWTCTYGSDCGGCPSGQVCYDCTTSQPGCGSSKFCTTDHGSPWQFITAGC